MNRPNLTQLSKEIYEANKLKGWHEQEYSNEHYLCLVISELMEAVEADKRGMKANMEAFLTSIKYARLGLNDFSKSHSDFKWIANKFESYIKDTIEDELADAVIRLLDLAGVRGYDVGRFLLKIPNMSKSFTENIFRVTTEIAYYKWSMEERVNFAILNIEELCNTLSIDLWIHVDLKLKYNLTRPYKHGKEY